MSAMKTLSACAVSLLLGVGMGFNFGYRYYDRHITNEAIRQMLEGMESSERREAASAIRAIGLIESGEPQKAAQSLSRPIADFYNLHADLAHNDQRTKDLLARIVLFASTNQFIADEITNEIHGKIQ